MLYFVKVVLEGVRGSGYQSDIAVDTISIIPGPCPGPATCNFEQGLCGFSNLLSDEFDWSRGQGSTTSRFTGPSSDHTTDSGSGGFNLNYFSLKV